MSVPANTCHKNNANVIQTSKMISSLLEYFTASATYIRTCANVVKRLWQSKKYFANYDFNSLSQYFR